MEKEEIIENLKLKYPYEIGSKIKTDKDTIKVHEVTFNTDGEPYIFYKGVILNQWGDETMINKKGDLNFIYVTSKNIIL